MINKFHGIDGQNIFFTISALNRKGEEIDFKPKCSGIFLKLSFVAFKKDNQIETFVGDILKKVIFFDKWQTTSFIIGFFFFIIFLISIVW